MGDCIDAIIGHMTWKACQTCKHADDEWQCTINAEHFELDDFGGDYMCCGMYEPKTEDESEGDEENATND